MSWTAVNDWQYSPEYKGLVKSSERTFTNPLHCYDLDIGFFLLIVLASFIITALVSFLPSFGYWAVFAIVLMAALCASENMLDRALVVCILLSSIAFLWPIKLAKYSLLEYCDVITCPMIGIAEDYYNDYGYIKLRKGVEVQLECKHHKQVWEKLKTHVEYY